MEKKNCSRCGKKKSVEEFNWKNKNEGIRHAGCRDCTKKVIKSHYERNKDHYKRRALIFSKNKRDDNRKKIVEYLEEHPCVDCGEKDPIVLQFDHVSGVKRKAVSQLAARSYSWKTIEEEIAKCKVRCANCHMRKTAKQFNWRFKG